MDRLDTVEKPWEDWELRFNVAAAPAGAVVARLDQAVVTRGGFTLGPVTEEIGWGETVGIVGPNGAGKTTLLNALLGRIPLDSGTQWKGPGVVVGEIDQARSVRGEHPPARRLRRRYRCHAQRRSQRVGQVRARRGARAPLGRLAVPR